MTCFPTRNTMINQERFESWNLPCPTGFNPGCVVIFSTIWWKQGYLRLRGPFGRSSKLYSTTLFSLFKLDEAAKKAHSPAKQFAFDNSECGLCFTAFLSQAIICLHLLYLRMLSVSWQTNKTMENHHHKWWWWWWWWWCFVVDDDDDDVLLLMMMMMWWRWCDDDDFLMMMMMMMIMMMMMVNKIMKSSFCWTCPGCSSHFYDVLNCLNSSSSPNYVFLPTWSTNQLLICSSFATKQANSEGSVLEGNSSRWNLVQIGSDPKTAIAFLNNLGNNSQQFLAKIGSSFTVAEGFL